MPLPVDTRAILKQYSAVVTSDAGWPVVGEETRAGFLADSQMPTLAVEQIMSLASDRQRMALINILATEPFECMDSTDARGDLLRLLQKQRMGPLMRLTVALQSMMVPGLEEWGEKALCERLLESPQVAASTWLLARRANSDLICTPRFLQIVLDTLPPLTSERLVGALAALLGTIAKEPLDAMPGIFGKLQKALASHLDLLPLGQAVDAIRTLRSSEPSDSKQETLNIDYAGVPSQLFERALTGSSSAPMVEPWSESAFLEYPTKRMRKRAQAAVYDRYCALSYINHTIWRNPTEKDVGEYISQLERLPLTDAGAAIYPHTLFEMTDAIGVEAYWPRLAALMRALPPKEEETSAAWLAAALLWPEDEWGDIQDAFLSWLKSPAVTVSEHLKRLDRLDAEGASLQRGFRLTPAPILEEWLAGMRQSEARTLYLQRIAHEHGSGIGIRDSLRMALSQSDDSETRKLAVILPEAPPATRTPKQVSQ